MSQLTFSSISLSGSRKFGNSVTASTASQLCTRALSRNTHHISFSTSACIMAKSWLNVPADSQFSLLNLPFGIIETQFSGKRVGVAIGNHILDLKVFAANNGFRGLQSIEPHLDVFSEPYLNRFAALGRPVHKQVREYLQNVFSKDTIHAGALKDNDQLQKVALIDQATTKVKLHLPMEIGDYTDCE